MQNVASCLSSLIALFFVLLSCCTFDWRFFKTSGPFAEFFKILEPCIKIPSTTGDIREWWSHRVWDFDRSTFWLADFFLNFRIPSIRFFANCNIPLVFRGNPLPFRCALDKWLLSIISKSKSFNCLLTSSIVTFQLLWLISYYNLSHLAIFETWTILVLICCLQFRMNCRK